MSYSYATRLPELYLSIARKFGVTIASPPRPKLSRTVSQTAPKPGSSIQRPPLKRARKTLDKTPTDGKLGPKRAHASLTRSATDSALPNLKIELSDIALSNIPLHRPSLQESRRYIQREVDFDAVDRATKAKLLRKAAIEQELQGAIEAMKKPNARMAVKDYVDSAERRSALGNTKSRKSKNPTRNPSAPGIQVEATPKVGRQRHTYPGLPQPYDIPQEPNIISASSDPHVPSSSVRPTASSLSVPLNTVVSTTPNNALQPRRRLFPSVDGTPSRRASKLSRSTSLHIPPTFQDEENEDELAQPSPKLPRLKRQASVSFKRPDLPSILDTSRGNIFTTPVKSRPRSASRQESLYPLHNEVRSSAVTETPVSKKREEVLAYTPDSKRKKASPTTSWSQPKHIFAGVSSLNEDFVPASSPPQPVDTASSTACLEPDVTQSTKALAAPEPESPKLQPQHQALANQSEVEKEPEEEQDIYAALGWDDDDELGLL